MIEKHGSSSIKFVDRVILTKKILEALINTNIDIITKISQKQLSKFDLKKMFDKNSGWFVRQLIQKSLTEDHSAYYILLSKLELSYYELNDLVKSSPKHIENLIKHGTTIKLSNHLSKDQINTVAKNLTWSQLEKCGVTITAELIKTWIDAGLYSNIDRKINLLDYFTENELMDFIDPDCISSYINHNLIIVTDSLMKRLVKKSPEIIYRQHEIMEKYEVLKNFSEDDIIDLLKNYKGHDVDILIKNIVAQLIPTIAFRRRMYDSVNLPIRKTSAIFMNDK